MFLLQHAGEFRLNESAERTKCWTKEKYKLLITKDIKLTVFCN